MKNPSNIQMARVLEPGIVELAWSTGETISADLTDLPSETHPLLS